jgi:cytosine permease
MLIVVLTAWSTNSFNLYSATLVGATLRPRQAQWQLSAVAGTVGTVLGLAGISDMLVPYLLWLGILIPPIAGIYLVREWMNGRAAGSATAPPPAWRPAALLAWLLGSGWAALAPRFGLALTPVPALDSLLVSAAVFALSQHLGQRAARN